MACILSLAVVVLFKHGLTIDTTIVKAKGMTFHGLSLAVVICIFSLVGFESATTLGGEAKNPLKNVPRAVIVSLIVTGAFMVFMSYVEVFGTRHYGTPLSNIALPLTVLSKIYGVTFFKIPVALGAMVSFFSLTLSCLNAGSRIIYPMAQHTVFPKHLGRAHKDNQTPHVAITMYIIVIVTIPTVLEIFTNPLTTFGDAGTLAAFGFLTAYFLISVAAPVYLKKQRELRPRHVVVAGDGLPVADGPAHRELLPGAAVPGRHLPVHLPGLHAGRVGVALRGEPSKPGPVRRDRDGPRVLDALLREAHR